MRLCKDEVMKGRAGKRHHTINALQDEANAHVAAIGGAPSVGARRVISRVSC
jgi:hypothetical protein